MKGDKKDLEGEESEIDLEERDRLRRERETDEKQQARLVNVTLSLQRPMIFVHFMI